jgi:hypothetical protein
MFRFVVVAPGALLLALPTATQAQGSTQSPTVESDNPINDQGSSYHYRSNITAVELNTCSPAYYLNQNFYGDVTVPSSASPSATPQWTVVDRTGQLEWHDHRFDSASAQSQPSHPLREAW